MYAVSHLLSKLEYFCVPEKKQKAHNTCCICKFEKEIKTLTPYYIELANSKEKLISDSNSSNEKLVVTLYEALNSFDSDTVVNILAPHLDWWFHGPPSHQFLMPLLTGGAAHSSAFRFIPHSVTSFGPTVVVEGCDNDRSISWVHAWTVTHGIITHLREYFNTSLTVTRFAAADSSSEIAGTLRCPSVWESTLSDRVGKSVPGLILTI